MKTTDFSWILIALALFLCVSTSYAQSEGKDVYWHIDPGVKDCSMVIDPSLTQTQWNRYTRQISAIATSKSLASAEPLGYKNFTIGLNYSITPIDQHDSAWINTFTHPDENCPLGDEIKLPSFIARYGISDKMDVGAFWITAPEANYGLMGGELKYAFRQRSPQAPSFAIRTSLVILTGVPDYNISIYSVDLIASKRILQIIPYVGIKESFGIGTERTSKVNLDTKSTFFTQGFIGAKYSIWKFNLSVEYNIAEVNTSAFLIGFNGNI